MKPRRSLGIVILLIVLPQLILIGELICMKLAQGFYKNVLMKYWYVIVLILRLHVDNMVTARVSRRNACCAVLFSYCLFILANYSVFVAKFT